ncbi:MAG: hypothetical protein ACOCZV_02165 [Nanoarchaeota archaeon]
MDSELDTFINRFTKGDVFSETRITQSKGSFFYVPERIENLVSSAKETPSMTGLYLGTVRDGTFHASLSLLEMLKAHTKRHITLNKKASWLFVCGRDVFFENVMSAIPDDKGLFLVCDDKHEVIGLGKQDRQKGKRLVQNITDIGKRLRQEQGKKR